MNTQTHETGQYTRPLIAFLIAVPLAWAVLLVFHGAGPGADGVYASLRDEADTWMLVHVGTLVFIGLMGVALWLLVRDLPGTAARISRLAIGPFVLFYGAGEALLGVATGALVQHANDVGADQRPAAANAAQGLWDNFIASDLLIGLGTVAWIVAAIAAAVAYHRLGAPLAVTVLLGLSAIVCVHAPPFGPFGLLCFAVAAALVVQRAPRAQAARVVRTAVP